MKKFFLKRTVFALDWGEGEEVAKVPEVFLVLVRVV